MGDSRMLSPRDQLFTLIVFRVVIFRVARVARVVRVRRFGRASWSGLISRAISRWYDNARTHPD